MSNITNLILEKLSVDKMTKEFIKGNKTLINKFEDHMRSKLDSWLITYREVNFTTKSPLFKKQYVTLPIKFQIVFGSFSIKSKAVPELDGLLLGVDLTDFDIKKNTICFYGLEKEEKTNRDIGSMIYNKIGGGRGLFDTYEMLNSSNDDIERNMIVQELFEKFGVDTSYIDIFYPNLFEFFIDACVPNERVDWSSGKPYIDMPTHYFSTGSKFFTGPYGKKICESMFDDAREDLYREFDGFYLKPDCFTYFSDRTFLPWAMVLMKEPDIASNDKYLDSFMDKILYYYNMSSVMYFSSLKRIGGRGSNKYLGAFDGMSENYLRKNLGNPLQPVTVKSKGNSTFYWSNW